MKFGMIPHDLHEQLLDHSNYQSRTHGVEELKNILYDSDLTSVPPENIVDFIGFLRRLLDDTNFKVLYGTLEVLNLLLVKLGYHAELYVENIVYAAVKVLGDTRAVTRHEYIKVYMQMMRVVRPQVVLDLMMGQLKHKNSRVREDVINIITASILTHPRGGFDIDRLCYAVAPCLADSKRKVRHAALELFAVFASYLGTGKMQPLVKAVDEVELKGEVEGLMAAVQARIARHILPKLTPDGTVEYAMTIPKPGQRRGPQFGSGADLEWVIGGGRTQSAQSHRSESDSEPPSGYGSPGCFLDETPAHRRVLSAGKGKNKLPWEMEGLPAARTSPQVKTPGRKDQLNSVLQYYLPGSLYRLASHYFEKALHLWLNQTSSKKLPTPSFLVAALQISSEDPQSPKLSGSSKMPVKEDLHFTGNHLFHFLFQRFRMMNKIQHEFSLGNPTCLVSSHFAVPEPHQPRISGRKGLLGMSRRSGSVDSDLQFLGSSNPSDREKAPVHGNISRPPRTPRPLCGHPGVERTFSLPSNPAAQGALILPSYPLAPAAGGQLASPPARRNADAAVSMSSTWPNKRENSPRCRAPSPCVCNYCLLYPSGETQERWSPVPLRASLVRSPSSHRVLSGAKPVPPIPRGTNPLPDRAQGTPQESEKTGQTGSPLERPAERSLQLDLSHLSLKDGEEELVDREEMLNSLRSLRYSAAKKRAKLSLSGSEPDPDSPDSAVKLELALDSPSQTSPPVTSPLSESGLSSLQDSLSSPPHTTPCGTKASSGSSSPSVARPRVARVSSGKLKGAANVEYSPNQGVTFRDKVTSDVSVVGQRLAYSNGPAEPEEVRQRETSPPVVRPLGREPLRAPRPPRGSQGSTGTMQQISISLASPADGMSEGIIGRGVFGSSAAVASQQSVMSSSECSNSIGKASVDPPAGVYGHSVQHNSHTSTAREEPEMMEDVVIWLVCWAGMQDKVKLSKSARDKMRQRRLEQEELLHIQSERRRVESVKERLRMIGGWNLNGKIIQKSMTESPQENSPASPRGPLSPIFAPSPIRLYGPPTPPALKGPSSPARLKRSSSLKKARSSLSHSSDELSPGPRAQRKEGPEAPELRPFSKPELALNQGLQLLASDDWERKIEGLTIIRSLSQYHSDVLMSRLHDACLAVIQEVKNLRSGVSRVAVVCLGDMFTHLQRGMDQELDGTVKVLLHKAGESNAFIRQDVDNTLDCVVQSCTPTRALSALLTGGLSHLNSVVRKCTAQHLADLVERMGPGRLLSGTKDLTDRMLPAVARLAQDSSQETRYYGRQMLFSWMTHPDFDKMIEKHLQPKDLITIRDTVSTLRTKGLGEMPLDTPSARGRRSLPGSGTVRASSLTREPRNIAARETGENTWKPSPRTLVDKTEYVKQLTGLLGAKDFRDRTKGIDQLLDDCQQSPDLVIANMFPIFDAFKSRLQDSNSKVNLHALESLQKIILLLKDNLAQVVYILVPAVVESNLNSKNNAIYNAAVKAVQTLIQNIDNTLLLQPFCTKAQFLSGKAKVDMIENVADLVTELYPRKPQLVEQKVLPLLWHLLGTSGGNGALLGRGGSVRSATAKLCRALLTHMGPGLEEHGAMQPPHISKGLRELLGTIST
ncbi:TGRM1 protein, partial [Atractosteus spatula]|nr:TGRM1 protein [Atractosteus spatula]